MPSQDIAALLRPRSLVLALLTASGEGRVQVGAEVLADMIVPPHNANRSGLCAELVPLISEAMDPLVVGDLVARTVLEAGVVVYSVPPATLRRLVKMGLERELYALGLEQAPPQVPEPRRPGLGERVLGNIESLLHRVQRSVAVLRRRHAR